MKNISRTADLSKLYTSYSIRATDVTVLDHSNFEARHMMRASVHKSEASIRHKRNFWHIWSGMWNSYRIERNSRPFGDIGTDILSQRRCTEFNIHLPSTTGFSLPSLPVFHITQTNTLKNVIFASGAFSNGNVTINVNSKKFWLLIVCLL